MPKRRKRIATLSGDFPQTNAILTTAIRYTWIALLGATFLFGSILLEKARPESALAEAAGSVGLAVISVLLGFIIYDLFGGPPELRALRAAFEEFRVGGRTLGQGITAIYTTRESAKNDVLDDLKISKKSCRMYASVYISEVVKHSDFNGNIARAAQLAKSSGESYIFSYCSLHPEPEDAHGVAILEMWARREGDKSTQSISDRIHRGTEMFIAAALSVKERANIEVSRRYYVGYPSPHSMIIIDDQVVYVSFYDWYHKRGDHALTLRLENGPWAQTFLREADIINDGLSVDAGIRWQT